MVGGGSSPVLYSTKVCYLYYLELGLFPHSRLEVQPTLTKNVECWEQEIKLKCHSNIGV